MLFVRHQVGPLQHPPKKVYPVLPVLLCLQHLCGKEHYLGLLRQSLGFGSVLELRCVVELEPEFVVAGVTVF